MNHAELLLQKNKEHSRDSDPRLGSDRRTWLPVPCYSSRLSLWWLHHVHVTLNTSELEQFSQQVSFGRLRVQSSLLAEHSSTH